MIACRRCGVVAEVTTAFCGNCGSPLGTPGVAPTTVGTAQGDPNGMGKLAVPGLIVGIAALLFLPIILGPLGIVFGVLSWRAGSRLGLAAFIVSVITTPVGMIIGAMVAS